MTDDIGFEMDATFQVDRDKMQELCELRTPAMIDEYEDPPTGITVEVWLVPPEVHDE